jgi:D-aminoacyl-tRNA deacylase
LPVVRALVQRVTEARVRVSLPGGQEEVVGEIGLGLVALIGVTHGDDAASARRLAERIWHLRVLADDTGAMNRSLADRADAGDLGSVLVVSQFTLYGDTSRGRRPSWLPAAPSEVAEPLVEEVTGHLRHLGATVATGRFGAHMAVELVNDGPVTLMLET